MRAIPPTKECIVCNQTMTQRSYESMTRWNGRRYCSHTCANTKPCECGNPIKQVIRVQIGRRNISMRVCSDCYDSMIKDDKGAW